MPRDRKARHAMVLRSHSETMVVQRSNSKASGVASNKDLVFGKLLLILSRNGFLLRRSLIKADLVITCCSGGHGSYEGNSYVVLYVDLVVLNDTKRECIRLLSDSSR